MSKRESVAQEEEISVAETARRLRVQLPYTYSLLWSGHLKARKVNRQWRVDAASVAERLRRTRPVHVAE
jgi:excisionase family DNA binding protein